MSQEGRVLGMCSWIPIPEGNRWYHRAPGVPWPTHSMSSDPDASATKVWWLLLCDLGRAAQRKDQGSSLWSLATDLLGLTLILLPFLCCSQLGPLPPHG